MVPYNYKIDCKGTKKKMKQSVERHEKVYKTKINSFLKNGDGSEFLTA